MPEDLRELLQKPYIYKKFKIAFSTDIEFLKQMLKYDTDDNIAIITSERIRELQEAKEN